MDVGNDSAGGVVSLRGFRQSMVYNPIVEVEAYWDALRGVRMVPLRSDIDPRGIERALDFTFLIERIAPGLAKFRLAGRLLNDLMGMEVRGMPITACMVPESRDQIRQALNQVFEGPEVVTVALKGEGGFGRPKMEGRMLLLPLKSDLGDISRAIGCICIDGKIGRAPRKFRVVSMRRKPIGPFKTEQPLPLPQKAPQNTGFSEPAEAFEVAPAPDKARPRLRLIEGGAVDRK